MTTHISVLGGYSDKGFFLSKKQLRISHQVCALNEYM